MITKYVETEKVYTIMEELWIKYENKEAEFLDFKKNPVAPRVIGRTGDGFNVIFEPKP
jgi:hypothetical protein